MKPFNVFRTKLADEWTKNPEIFWDAIAKNYPYRGTWSPFKDVKHYFKSAEEVFKDSIENNLDIDKKDKAVDLGVGAGRTLLPLVKRFKQVYAVDISQDMLNIAVKNLKDLGYNNIIPIKNIDDKMQKIPSKSIDFIYSVTVFQHIFSEDSKQKLRESCFRVLKRGGQLCIDELVPEKKEEQIYNLYLKAGFGSVGSIRQNKESLTIWIKK